MKLQTFTLSLFFAILLLPKDNLVAQNIALGKNVTASSSDFSDPQFASPSNVNDGLGTSGQINAGNGSCASGTCTRWASAQGSDPQWIYIDLAGSYFISEVKLSWEFASASNFTIDVSMDAINWTTVQTISGNSTYVNIIAMGGVEARYVRMHGTARSTTFGYSLWEFEITGTHWYVLGPNIAQNQPVTSSSEQNGVVIDDNAVDGEGGTGDNINYTGGCTGTCSYWASNVNDNEWIRVDLGSVKTLYQVILYWREFMNANDFTIDVSTDDINWSTARSLNDNNAYVNTFNLQGVSARYVRVSGLTRNSGGNGFGLYEMEVYDMVSLPITLYDFNAGLKNDVVNVKWTASLDYGGEFIIERSSNGKDYAAIGKVSVDAGTNGLKQQYSYTDRLPLPGKSFYRIKYTEAGGAPQFSRMASITFSQTPKLVLYPNPVQKGKPIYVDFNKAVTGTIEIKMINALGTTVYSQKLVSDGYSMFEIPANPKITAGNYLVQVISNNGERHSKMVYIQ